MVIECFKKCPEYQDKLREYVTKAYLICLDEVTRAVIEKGFEVFSPTRGPCWVYLSRGFRPTSNVVKAPEATS